MKGVMSNANSGIGNYINFEKKISGDNQKLNR